MNTTYFVNKTTLDQGRALLNGKHLIIGTLNLPPYVSYTNVSINRTINDVNGFVYQIVLYLAAKYQFNFEYVQPADGAYGAFVNGSWNGLIGMLHRKELDLVAACLTVTYPRSQVVDFSLEFDDDPISLLIPYPSQDSTIDGIARPFQVEVWLGIGISIISIAIVLWKIFSVEFSTFKRIRENNSLLGSLWSLLHFNKIESQKITSSLSRAPVYLLLWVWCLAMIVLVNSYSSTVTSYLMAPRYQPMINSVEDIANSQRPIFMVQKYTSFDTSLLNTAKSESLALSKIGDSLRKHPELRLNPSEVKNAVDLVLNFRRSYTTEKAVLLSMIERDLKDTGQCRLYLAKEPWDTARLAFALPKSSPLTLIFSHEMVLLRETGLLDYWHRRTWPRPNRCTEPLTTKIKNHKKLTLNYVLSVFLLLGGGVAVSLLAFIVECIISKICRRYD